MIGEAERVLGSGAVHCQRCTIQLVVNDHVMRARACSTYRPCGARGERLAGDHGGCARVSGISPIISGRQLRLRENRSPIGPRTEVGGEARSDSAGRGVLAIFWYSGNVSHYQSDRIIAITRPPSQRVSGQAASGSRWNVAWVTGQQGNASYLPHSGERKACERSVRDRACVAGRTVAARMCASTSSQTAYWLADWQLKTVTG